MSQVKISSNKSDDQPSLVEDSPVSPTALLENVKRLVMNVISQENSKESFGRLNPDGSLLKMSQGSAQANLEGFLENSCMTFPRWGIVSDGVVGELRMSEPAIEESECLLLRTPGNQEPGVSVGRLQTKNGEPAKIGERAYDKKMGRLAQVGLTQQIQMLPKYLTTLGATESAGNYTSYRPGRKNSDYLSRQISMLPTLMAHNLECAGKEYNGTRHALKLSQAIQMLPTPTSRDYKDTGKMDNVPVNALLGGELGKNHGLKLQPAFAEWMMGFSQGWTELDPLEMPLFLNKRIRSSKQSQTLKEDPFNDPL